MPQKSDTQTLTNETEQLTDAIEKLDDHVEVLIEHDKFWRVFVKGVIGAIGAAIGATVILGAIVYILQQLSIIPVFGDVFDELLNALTQNK